MASGDCIAVLRGLQKLSRAALAVHGQNIHQSWKSSYCLQQFLTSKGLCSPTTHRPRDTVHSSSQPLNLIQEHPQDIGRVITSSTDVDDTVRGDGAAEISEPAAPEVAAESVSPVDNTNTRADHEDVSRKNKQALPALASRARQRRVPASRFSRLMSFTSLAAGLGVGAVAEFSRRSVGISSGGSSSSPSSHFLTEANINRLVSTLCRVRGAALKLGQMISIQDDQFINPQIQEIFQRVRDGADYMPARQCQKAIAKELGADWRGHLQSFEEMPVAAASIGQVHRAVLKDGREVVMKIQYPGVAQSIDSDVNNIMTLMNKTKLLPEGLFAENALRVARKELSWEVDYEREAECATRFASYLDGHPFLVVPKIIPELSSMRVLTMEYLEGAPLDRQENLSQAQRDKIGHHMLELCLREVFEFRFMQTDPNWSNFFYLPEERKVGLLDFGASRDFPKSFVDEYLRVIYAAANGDRKGVLDGSLKMGFLTGFETDVMNQAHTDAVMVLGEPFMASGPFDFGEQHVTNRIRTLMPVMLKHRLTPPPEETYSLHRKLSGAFLLCTKLKSSINCRPILEKIVTTYQYD